ncbi:MAG: TIGR01777 family oxidoreductase [Saprospiraceae bacterium]
MQTILITGGTGLVGSRLSRSLKERGYKVIYLSRKENMNSTFPAYKWDIDKGEIDNRALEQADYIVHLAGAGVADKSWTKKRKQVIIDSRVKSGALLQQKLKEIGKRPKAVVCASASGYYGDRGGQLLDESASKGSGFLVEVVEKWEAANAGFEDVTDRVAQLRIGIVLSTLGGALEKMLPTYKARIGTYFGSGDQYYSWIHIDDLANMFIHAIENEKVSGVYNAVAPNPVTNKRLAEAIGEGMGKSAVLLPAPAMVMRLAMGEMSSIVLDGVRLCSNKIENTGFKFLYDDVSYALRDVIERKI